LLSLYHFTGKAKVSAADGENYLRSAASANVQLLMERLFELPRATVPGGGAHCVELPKPTSALPRLKPPPKPKEPTKWEKYAQSKGIQNRKRDRMVWDDEAQEWKPRWGYKRINDEKAEWVLELEEGDDPTVDKFREKRQEKKLRVMKNKEAQLKNLQGGARAAAKNRAGMMPSGIPTDLSGGNATTRTGKGEGRGKKRTEEALRSAQISTASFGRFDAVQTGEPKRIIESKRRKFTPAEASSSDLERSLKVLDRVLGGNGKGSATPAASAPAPMQASATGGHGKKKTSKGGKKYKKGK